MASSVTAFKQPVWKLIFNAGSQIHAAIMPFLIDLSYGSHPDHNGTLANVMRDWYSSFIIHIDPNAESWAQVVKPFWPQYIDSDEVMSVNYTELGAVDDIYYDESKRCEFFWDNGDVVQN